jgi:hypothetical protein
VTRSVTARRSHRHVQVDIKTLHRNMTTRNVCDRVNIRYFSVLTNQYDPMVIQLISCLNILPPNRHRICDPHLCCIRDTRWHRRLRHYAICRKVEGSSPLEVTEFFCYNLPNPSGRTMVLVFTQPLTEMSTRRPFWRQRATGA